MENIFTRNFTITALVLIFVIAPLLGFGFSKLSSGDSATISPPQRSKEQLQSVLDEKVSGDYTITSVRRVETWWYLLQVTEGSNTSPVLLGDFSEKAEDIIVITNPGEQLDEYNISSIGVPYSVIDELNKAPEEE